MTKYVALLRGIGPINPNMKSEKLRSVFEDLDLKNVKTVITSGNIIFESPIKDMSKLAGMIEQALPLKLGFSSSTIVKSMSQLQLAYDQNPYKDMEHNQKTYLLVTFFKDNHEAKLAVVPEDKPYSILKQDKDVLYGIVDLSNGQITDYMTWLEKEFSKEITSRTLKTIERILLKMNG